MAIDSAAKRFSILNSGWVTYSSLFPPDGSVDAPDRAHFLNLYGGNAFAGVAAPTFSGNISNIIIDLDSGEIEYDFSSYFSGADSYSIEPAVEVGWSFNTSTCVLTVNPDTLGEYGPYTITATNAGGTAESNAFGISVIEAEEDANTGGWWFRYEQEMFRREEEERKRRQLEEKAKEIQEDIDRELVEELMSQEVERQRIEELNRLRKLAEQHKKDIEELGGKVYEAAEQAIMKGTYSTMERLERELKRAREEEIFLVQALNLILEN